MGKTEKKLIKYLLLFIAIVSIYQYFTGESILNLPGKIIDMLDDTGEVTKNKSIYKYDEKGFDKIEGN